MLKTKELTWALAISAVTLFGAGTMIHAQENPSQRSVQTRQGYESPNQASRSASEQKMVPARMFIKKAAQSDLAEVQLGQLAQQKGTTSAVRNFGQRMITDHTKNADELKAVAQQENMNWPSDVNAQQKATYQKLSNLSGKKFDEMYARDMVKDHTMDVTAFKQEARTSNNEAVKNFASKSLPVLEAHLRLAHRMLDSVNSKVSSGQAGAY